MFRSTTDTPLRSFKKINCSFNWKSGSLVAYLSASRFLVPVNFAFIALIGKKRDGALTNCLGGMIWLRAHSDSWRRMQHRRFCRAPFGIFWRNARDTRLVFFSLASRASHVAPKLRQFHRLLLTPCIHIHCHLRNVNQNGNPTCQQECQLSLTCSRQTRSPLRLLFAFFCWAAVILMFFQPVKCLCTK